MEAKETTKSKETIYRFFGLRLKKCDFEGVRLSLTAVLSLEEKQILSDEDIELIKSKLKADVYIEALKLTLHLLEKYFINEELEKNWFQAFFEKLGSSENDLFRLRLRKGEFPSYLLPNKGKIFLS